MLNCSRACSLKQMSVLNQALARMPRIVGSDIDPHAIEIARAQAGRVGLAGSIDLTVANCADMEATLEGFGVAQVTQGCVVGNPPYGVRLMARDLDVFYGALQKGIDALLDTWTLTVITPDIHFDDYLGATPLQENAVYNGALETTVRTYQLGQAEHKTLPLVSLSGRDVVVPVLSDHPDQFAARLRKNAKARRKWAEQNQVFAFRLYDADLPDYAVSIDLFLASEEIDTEHVKRTFDVPYLLISEYQAPKSIDPHKAFRRFEDAVRIAAAVLEIPARSGIHACAQAGEGWRTVCARSCVSQASSHAGIGAHIRTRSSKLSRCGLVPRPPYNAPLHRHAGKR